MLQFVRDEADILVSTTIIENGLDIPRANTIIINRADRFGLAELYQLRGRVGRSNQRAYAYLLVPPPADFRLAGAATAGGLKEFSDLGAGFRIAALDLEFAAREICSGREQHGHIGAVGFDLYCQMLERAVAERKGEAVGRNCAPLSIWAGYPHPPRVHRQRKSASANLQAYRWGFIDEAEREEVQRELQDRFGPPPQSWKIFSITRC